MSHPSSYSLEGIGEPDNFLGLPADLACYEDARICVIPVPFEASTSFGHGTNRGPEALIEASRSIEGYDVETKKEIYHLGIHTTKAIQGDTAADTLSQLQSKVEAIIADGKFPVALGGEHTISAAPIRAIAKSCSKFSILQFDAHTDLRHAYEGNPLSHASVMARAKEVPQVQNVVAVGIRAMATCELANSCPEDIFYDHQLTLHTDWIDQVLSRLAQTVYISFDIDVFDSALMPATGTPEPGGMTWFQALSLLKRVCESRTVVGFDLVELMPIEGMAAPNFTAAKLLYKFLNYRFASECKESLS